MIVPVVHPAARAHASVAERTFELRACTKFTPSVPICASGQSRAERNTPIGRIIAAEFAATVKAGRARGWASLLFLGHGSRYRDRSGGVEMQLSIS
jgi:hypothetical protein